jgi:8-oxo-dGTP pyrophosphatase MutT (NUDIX family)
MTENKLLVSEYVLGFLFNDDDTGCVLIRKQKPEWQAGLFNGVGGKIKPGESLPTALVREFKEQAGVDTGDFIFGWRKFCILFGERFAVHCFAAHNSDALATARTQTTETIAIASCLRLHLCDCVPNLRWLIPMAIGERDTPGFLANVCYR